MLPIASFAKRLISKKSADDVKLIKPVRLTTLIITREVAIACRICIPVIFSKVGTIKNPPPTPNIPDSNPVMAAPILIHIKQFAVIPLDKIL